MGLSVVGAKRLALQIFNEFDKQIVEATNGTAIPPKFIAGLIGNEAGKDKGGRIVRQATRFEPGVYKHLIAVRDGTQSHYGNIRRMHIRDASDAAIRALATSYEATQMMGYHCITLHCTLADLKNPDKHFFYTVKLLQLNGYPVGADNAHMDNEMRQWNTGSERGKTYHEDYVPNARLVRDAYAELEKTRIARTVETRVAGHTETAPVTDSAQSERIEIAGTCPNCGLPNGGGRFADDFCPDCGKTFDSIKALDAGAKETPTGDTTGEPPKTEVQPTKLKGWIAAIIGAISTFLGSIATWYAGLPDIVQASILIAGGLVTSSLIVSVIWLKNKREGRAADKDLEIIRARGTNV